MDVYKTMISINKIGKYMIILMVLLSLISSVSALPPGPVGLPQNGPVGNPNLGAGNGANGAASDGTGTGNIRAAMTDLCHNAQLLLGGAALILIVLAAVVYAIGQITGAETRARASVWATAMIIGALVGIAIYLLVPSIVTMLLKNTGAETVISGNDPCNFGAAIG